MIAISGGLHTRGPYKMTLGGSEKVRRPQFCPALEGFTTILVVLPGLHKPQGNDCLPL